MAGKNVVGQHGRKLKPNTTNWAVQVDKAVALRVVQLHDEWAGALGITVDLNKNKVTRQRAVEDGERPVPVGISMPTWLIEQIEGSDGSTLDGMVARYQRRKYEIAKWALTHGITKLSLEGIKAAYPNSQPSLSLVGLLALTLGLKDFGKHFAPTPGREKNAGKKARLVKQDKQEVAA